MGDVIAAPGMQPYLARLDGRPVGEGALCLAGDNIALLAGAGTPGCARPRRAESAAQHRLADAREAGADLAVVGHGARHPLAGKRDADAGSSCSTPRIILVKRPN